MFAIHQFTRNDIFESEDTYSKQLHWVPFAAISVTKSKRLLPEVISVRKERF